MALVPRIECQPQGASGGGVVETLCLPSLHTVSGTGHDPPARYAACVALRNVPHGKGQTLHEIKGEGTPVVEHRK